MDWHTRYLQQAGWTASLRAHLFQKAGLTTADRILDLGCGTGALLADFPAQTALHGLDLSLSAVQQAKSHAPGAALVCADGFSLPYPAATFDLCFCHFVLLWVADPLRVVAEMCRVTRPGGWVLALAEPDYGGRVDYPVELAELGRCQTESLRNQGADPEIGRQLAGIFLQAGLTQVETGVLGGEWQHPGYPGETELEWEVLAADLAGKIPSTDLQKLKEIDQKAWKTGQRILFVPTFYAAGLKP
jgi:SAM-dependent methyltransferase